MSDTRHRLRIDWDDLRLFLEIARTGTLTAAAKRLRLSQPTAGRRLRSLESAVGTPLFQRTPAGFLLTDEGEAMLVHAEHMEEDAIALERKLVGGGQELSGVIRISASDWFAGRVLAGPLADFAIAQPLVTIELHTAERLVDLQRRETDLAFRFVPFDRPDIVQRRFAHIRYGLYAAPAYLARRGDPNDCVDGRDHHLVTMESAFNHIEDAIWLRQRWPQARLAMGSNSREVQADACVRGAGIAILPMVIGDSLPLQRIATDELPGRDLWLGYHSDLRRLRRLRALVDHLVEAIGDQKAGKA